MLFDHNILSSTSVVFLPSQIVLNELSRAYDDDSGCGDDGDGDDDASSFASLSTLPHGVQFFVHRHLHQHDYSLERARSVAGYRGH